MLGIYWYYAIISPSEAHNPVAARDERLFVGQGNGGAGPQGRDGGGETREAHDAVENDVGGCLGERGCGTGAPDLFCFETVENARGAAFEGDYCRVELF